ncbi:TrbC/VirB2 family protein [Acidobacteria bacterium AB60]|nr:TrbC/VirB2 family protein [Acidobacteria bacterium AB60]
MTAGTKPSEVPMRITLTSPARRRIFRWKFPRRFPKTLPFVTLVLLVPAAAIAQSGSPFDTGFTALQNLFTGTVAKVASLIAIVIGGYEFAHGEPGAKKTPHVTFGFLPCKRSSRFQPRCAQRDLS